MWAKFVQFIRSSIFKKELAKGGFYVESAKDAGVAGQLDGERCFIQSNIFGDEGLYCIFIILPEESFTIPIYWRGYGVETHYHNGYRVDITGTIQIFYEDNTLVSDAIYYIFQLTTSADIG